MADGELEVEDMNTFGPMLTTAPVTTDDVFNDAFESLLVSYLIELDPPTKDVMRGQLVAKCLPYVYKIARGLARRGTDPVDDLIQVGCVGLIKALEKFNPLAGSRFKTYATYLITGEIRHYIRDKAAIIKAPRQMYELYYRVNQMVQRLSEELGRTPTDFELAAELECPVDTIHAVNIIDRRRNLISLDQYLISQDGSQGESLYIERLVDDKHLGYVQNQEDKLLLEKAMAHLKEELRTVVKMTYYEDMSQMEIAKVLGISQMQVSRRLRKALDILHGALYHELLDAV